MPVPTAVTDLSTTAANNSPAATESPGDGDDYIRALSKFIADSYAGTLTAAFRVGSNGVPYSTSMHNPTGTLTGTTNQLILSGTYTPTAAAVTNVDSATTNANTMYFRLGNVVAVAGLVTVNPTSGSADTELTLTLPIASSLSSAQQLAGVAVRKVAGKQQICAVISGNATSDIANFTFYNDSETGGDTWGFLFFYTIV